MSASYTVPRTVCYGVSDLTPRPTSLDYSYSHQQSWSSSLRDVRRCTPSASSTTTPKSIYVTSHNTIGAFWFGILLQVSLNPKKELLWGLWLGIKGSRLQGLEFRIWALGYSCHCIQTLAPLNPKPLNPKPYPKPSKPRPQKIPQPRCNIQAEPFTKRNPNSTRLREPKKKKGKRVLLGHVV